MVEPITVVVIGQSEPAVRDRVRAAAPDQRLVFVDTAQDAESVLSVADAVAGTLSGTQVQRAERLRWVHSWAAGANADLSPELLDSAVVLTSSVGNGAIPLAEHAMLLMMMLNRDVPRWSRAQAEHRWDRHTHGELAGQTLGIVGLGHCGADLALKAQAFHMRVLGIRRRPELDVAGVEVIYPMHRLEEFLGECDVVVVTAPITDQTAGMFGAAQFAAMKPTAHWICISRGGIAEDRALLDALRQGTIAAAGLDAHGVEPLPADSPFWDLPNVIITPHNGATTAATARRGIDIFIENLQRFLAGENLVNVVDKVNGY